MGFLKEFKEFAVKGNVIDMAVGIIIGAAFTPIVKSLVDDVIMPPVGWLTNGIDFSGLAAELPLKSEGGEPVLIRYGNFINMVITFTITAFAVFLLVKSINKLKREEKAAPPPAPTTKDCPQCLMAVPLKAKKCGHCTSVLA